MRTDKRKIIIVVLAGTLLLAAGQLCGAAERGDKDSFWSEGGPRRHGKGFELTEERIERILKRLAETDPKKAEQLSKLRERDPEKFKAELRETLREQFSKRKKERGFHSPMGSEKGDRPFHRRSPGGGGWEHGEGMRERHREYLEWLEKNDPEEAKRLTELREKNPEYYHKRLGYRFKRHRRIMEASKDNPELARVLKEDMQLRDKRDQLLKQIKKAKDGEEKKRLAGELQNVLNQRFDLIVERKQIGYERLLEKLESLKERIKKREADVEKWKAPEYKSKNVQSRLNRLLKEAETFSWD